MTEQLTEELTKETAAERIRSYAVVGTPLQLAYVLAVAKTTGRLDERARVVDAGRVLGLQL